MALNNVSSIDLSAIEKDVDQTIIRGVLVLNTIAPSATIGSVVGSVVGALLGGGIGIVGKKQLESVSKTKDETKDEMKGIIEGGFYGGVIGAVLGSFAGGVTGGLLAYRAGGRIILKY
jgi:hypothetical protein